MNGLLKISVVLPVYNVEKYLPRCLDSIINQDSTDIDIEIICVEDGSQDLSWHVLQEYKIKHNIICLKNDRNSGPAYARNRGLEKATGDYVWFIDADDWIPNYAVKELCHLIENQNLDILFFDAETVYENIKTEYLSRSDRRTGKYGQVCKGVELYGLFDENNDHHVEPWGAIYSRRFLTDKNLKFYNGIIYEDDLFYVKTILQADRVYCLNKVYYYYYKWANSLSSGIEYTRENRDFRSTFIIYTELLTLLFSLRLDTKGKHLLDRHINSWYEDLAKILPKDYRKIRFDSVRQEELFFTFIESIESQVKFLKSISKQELKKYDKIIVYGAGKIGREFIKLLMIYNIDNFFLAVTKKTENKVIYGCTIHELSEFKCMAPNCLVIVAVGLRYAKEMEDYAQSQGFEHIVKLENIEE